MIEVKDEDFEAKFNGKNWTVEWVWKTAPPNI